MLSRIGADPLTACDDQQVTAPRESAGEPLLPGSIENHLVIDVPRCAPDTTAEQLRSSLAGRRYGSAADVAVCAEGPTQRLLGLIPLEAVLAADPSSRAEELMDPDPPVVSPGSDQEQAAWKAARHGESSLAVVDSSGSFRGLVPPARLLTVLLAEHDEDLARLAGVLKSSTSARHALTEPVGARAWHRLPWLLVGLVGSAAAAVLVAGFEHALTADGRLAFFIPGIVYMAAAVGTQTEILVIRGLAIGVRVRRVATSEAVTGLLVGVVLAAITVPAAWALLGSVEIALTLGSSLVAACAVATMVAIALPWALNRFGRDPAFGTGPVATVVQDLLSLLIYFGVATAVVL